MAVKAWIPIIALCWCTAAAGALPGVVELHRTPEEVTDRELAPLLDARVRAADVVAIGETVHGSSYEGRVVKGAPAMVLSRGEVIVDHGEWKGATAAASS